jgi:vacuolar-type H+-ATPase subunit H
MTKKSDDIKEAANTADETESAQVENKEVVMPEDITKAVEEILAKAQRTSEEILENAQKKADEIVGDAVKKVENISSTVGMQGSNPSVAAVEEDYSDLEQYVTVRLFKDKGKYKDDVFVAVNGESCLIQRGKDVRIKRKFAQVLEQSMRQDEFAAMYSEGLQNEFLEKEAAGML